MDPFFHILSPCGTELMKVYAKIRKKMISTDKLNPHHKTILNLE
jgi:hypothetical protein